MATYICHECYEQWDVPYAIAGTRVTKRPACPGCGPGTKVTRIEDGPEHERHEDTGAFYGHPGDRLRGLE